jgi:putative ABC transport system permease protein
VGDLVGGTKSIMLAILVIVLIVAGLGMFNTILMATFERNAEFGYLRCVGARRRDIFRLIFTETLLLSAAGLAVGLAVGYFAAMGIDQWIRGFLPYVPAGKLVRPTWLTILAAVITVMMLGALAGIYPGFKASRVSPMEAVRNE